MRYSKVGILNHVHEKKVTIVHEDWVDVSVVFHSGRFFDKDAD